MSSRSRTSQNPALNENEDSASCYNGKKRAFPGDLHHSPIGDAVTSSTTCYRLNPSFRNAGVACIALSSLMGLSSVLMAYFNVDDSFPRPRFAATCFGLFWSCFVLLGVWLLLFHRSYRLLVTDDSIRQCGVISERTVTLSEVRELKWRRFPAGGSVRLRGVDGTLPIDLGSFAPHQRDELIQFLRAAVPDDRQCGWSQFRGQFQDNSERKMRTRRISLIVSLVLAFHAVAFLILWGLRFGNQFLVVAIINAALLVFFQRRARNHPSALQNMELFE